jgi:coenzyme F420-reducing hydrogenase alpha subunit
MAKIVIDPVTRIEGHLKIEVVTQGGEVKEARCAGLLFRGLEVILRGRSPRDAQRIRTGSVACAPWGVMSLEHLNARWWPKPWPIGFCS